MQYTPAIVVVGYERAGSLKRLLKSLSAAGYPDMNIPLVISLDGGGTREVRDIAQAFRWTHGDMRLLLRADQMGLKQHILSCGDLTHEYGSIIMLEDDLYVSPEFYSYASAALSFTETDPSVAGVSLYNHRFQVFARLPFEPIDDGYDNWYFQLASSWGQAWTEDQWEDFRSWLSVHDGEDLHGNGMPSNAAEWGESSWLKYAIKYLIQTRRFFLYPRISYTTNFFDEGEHTVNAVTDLQVPLRMGPSRAYHFSHTQESGARYDAYFENMDLPGQADLYGLKVRDGNIRMAGKSERKEENGKGRQQNQLFSTSLLPYRIIRSYGLKLRPMEANILLSIPGRDIFLYDLTSPLAPRKPKGPLSYLHSLRPGKKAASGRRSEVLPGENPNPGLLERYFYPGLNRKRITSLVRNGAAERIKQLKTRDGKRK
ncbi:MAG: hypothetical protein K5989_06190 [Lachnospiraceae bacterium]|nr:hypothetical protein [Lachnospiraceae bacterium]